MQSLREQGQREAGQRSALPMRLLALGANPNSASVLHMQDSFDATRSLRQSLDVKSSGHNKDLVVRVTCTVSAGDTNQLACKADGACERHQ